MVQSFCVRNVCGPLGLGSVMPSRLVAQPNRLSLCAAAAEADAFLMERFEGVEAVKVAGGGIRGPHLHNHGTQAEGGRVANGHTDAIGAIAGGPGRRSRRGNAAGVTLDFC